MFRSRLTRNAVVGALASGTGLTFIYDGESRRTLQVYSNIFPIVASHRIVELLNRDFKVVHNEIAAGIRNALQRKLIDLIEIEMCSMAVFYIQQAKVMRSRSCPSATYMSFRQRTSENYFSSKNCTRNFEDLPVQVESKTNHEASELKCSVSIPGIQSNFQDDCRNLIALYRLELPSYTSEFAKLEERYLTEFDRIVEIASQNDEKQNALPKSDDEKILSGILEHSPSPMLLMDYQHCIVLIDRFRISLERTNALPRNILEYITEVRNTLQ
jgi:YHS domain-containing protein